MATSGRKPNSTVDRLLLGDGRRFDFFQAVRLLERLYPARQPVGREASREPEVVRFRSRPDLSFPPTDVDEIRVDENGDRAEMTVSFMGLIGPHGVLPRHYTLLAAERERANDGALHAFLDLFHHRMVSLFYRAWERYRFPVEFERAAIAQGATGGDPASRVANGGLDRLSQHLLDLIGAGTGGILGSLEIDLRTLLFNAGLLAGRARSASALKGLLHGYFSVPTAILQFTGQWLAIPLASRTRLGRSNAALGSESVLGERYWDPQTKFTVRIGAVDDEGFRRFLPRGDAFGPLVQITRFFAGEELDFDIQLVVEAAQVPECRLSSRDGGGAQLGWSSWLKTRPFERDADDPVFDGRRVLASLSDTSAEESTPAGE